MCKSLEISEIFRGQRVLTVSGNLMQWSFIWVEMTGGLSHTKARHIGHPNWHKLSHFDEKRIDTGFDPVWRNWWYGLSFYIPMIRDIFFELPGWAVRCRWRASHCRLPTIPTALARTQRHVKELDIENWWKLKTREWVGQPGHQQNHTTGAYHWYTMVYLHHIHLYPPVSTCTLQQVQMLQFVFCLRRLSRCASLGALVCFLWRTELRTYSIIQYFKCISPYFTFPR